MRASVAPQRAVQLLQVEHDSVRALIDELNDAEMLQRDTIIGLVADRPSFKDLLAHLTTYEALALKALRVWQRGERHLVSDIMDSMRSPTRSVELHAGGILARRDHSLAQVLAEWEQFQAAITEAIADLDEDAWRRPPPWPTREAIDLGGMLEEIIVAPPRPLYRHLPVHIPDSAEFIRALR